MFVQLEECWNGKERCFSSNHRRDWVSFLWHSCQLFISSCWSSVCSLANHCRRGALTVSWCVAVASSLLASPSAVGVARARHARWDSAPCAKNRWAFALSLSSYQKSPIKMFISYELCSSSCKKPAEVSRVRNLAHMPNFATVGYEISWLDSVIVTDWLRKHLWNGAIHCFLFCQHYCSVRGKHAWVSALHLCLLGAFASRSRCSLKSCVSLT